MDMNPISFNSVEDDVRKILRSFRINDLKTLLGAFAQNKTGQKSELRDRAIELLRTRPANITNSAYIAKIYEIYRSLQYGMTSNAILMRSSLLQNQQQQRQIIPSMGQTQNPPQYHQQSMHRPRAGLPQVMSQMQVNNNIQYTAPEPSGTSNIRAYLQLPPNQQMSIEAQDALGLGTMACGNNSYTSSIETVTQIKYNKLPFYEVIDEIIKPTLLTSMVRCTLLNVPEDMKEATFQFTLSPENANLVTVNRQFSHGKYKYLYEFQIRICQLIEPVPNESPDYMPLDLHIRFGMKECQLPPTLPITRPETKSRRAARPIDCTENVKLSPIVSNNITVNWTPDGKYYVFAIYLVKKLSADSLIKKLQDKGGRNSEETKNYIIKKLADVDPDLATTSYHFSLVCPLSKMRMKIPAKSVHCDHLQCFDAITFILMNEKKPSWMCPTCNKPCLYDDLQIENYFLEVISSPILKYCSKEIEILADGTWKIYEQTKETINTNSTDKVNLIDIVDLDSDDETCIEPKTEPSPESSRTQEPENLKSFFIDLTLSDDEGPPTKRDKQEIEVQATDAIQPGAVVDLRPQAQVQPQQAVNSFEQGVVIEIVSSSPPSSPTTTTEAS